MLLFIIVIGIFIMIVAILFFIGLIGFNLVNKHITKSNETASNEIQESKSIKITNQEIKEIIITLFKSILIQWIILPIILVYISLYIDSPLIISLLVIILSALAFYLTAKIIPNKLKNKNLKLLALNFITALTVLFITPEGRDGYTVIFLGYFFLCFIFGSIIGFIFSKKENK